MKKNELMNKIVSGVLALLLGVLAVIVVLLVFKNLGLVRTSNQTADSVNESMNETEEQKMADEALEKSQESTADNRTEEQTAENQTIEGQTSISGTKNNQNTDIKARAEELMANMSLGDKIAQMFIITPEALTDVSPVTEALDHTKNSYNTYPVGGIIYFEQNILSPDQLSRMSQNIQKYSLKRTGVQAFISTDEEGGRVARLADNAAMGIPNVGAMRNIGNSGSTDKAYQTGVIIGNYLLQNGINMDFAPVADVDTDSNQSVVGDRAFGSDPQIVAKMAASEIKGLKDSGVSPVLKHFPGHGATVGDTHTDYAYTGKTIEEMRECELIPFQEGIEAGCEIVMVGHISAPNVIGDNTPSSMSEEIITNILREELGFKGIVVTDALNMGAIIKNYTSDVVAVKAVEAGVDMLLMPENFKAAYQSLMSAVAGGTITEERIDESVRRILELKLSLQMEN